MLLFGGKNDDLAVLAFTAALSINLRVVTQRQVNNTAFIGAHWLQHERTSGLMYTLGHTTRQTFKRLLATLTVVANIDHDLRPFLYPSTHQQVDQKLHRP